MNVNVVPVGGGHVYSSLPLLEDIESMRRSFRENKAVREGRLMRP